MAQDQHDRKLRGPGRTALLIVTVVVVEISAIGYLVTWGARPRCRFRELPELQLCGGDGELAERVSAG